EAVDLGVFRYFEKPLDTEEGRAAVYAEMFGEGEMILVPKTAVPREVDVHLPRSATRRLDTLRADTGASGLILVAGNGQILHRVGGQSGLNLERLSVLAAKIMVDGLGMADELGSDNPVTIQYHGGDAIELYLANVGRDYFLTLWFDVKSKRGRMGTIWVFAQRAIRELMGILPELGLKAAALPVMDTAVPIPTKPAPKPTADPPAEETVIPGPPEPEPEPEPEPAQFDAAAAAAALGLDESALTDMDEDVDDFWETAVTDSQVITGDGISFAEAQKQGLMAVEPAADEPLPEDLKELAALAEAEPEVDVDDFWDTAVTSAGGGAHSGLSFEEAKKQGLIANEAENEE
ncbi:MAG: roadblock/LC7 domain-containing protein, partial [Anaerolineae bacterium]